MKRLLPPVCLIASATPARPQAPPPAKPLLTGSAAWLALQGNTVTGTTADGPYADYFLPDGTAVHSDVEGREAGHWVLKDRTVCFDYPADPDEQAECRQVEVEGTRGAFVDSDGSRYPFDILPGDARGLR